MPSLCRTPACAARHDNTVEVGIAFRPVKNVGQSRPVGFVAQVGLARLRSGHDDAVKLAVQ